MNCAPRVTTKPDLRGWGRDQAMMDVATVLVYAKQYAGLTLLGPRTYPSHVCTGHEYYNLRLTGTTSSLDAVNRRTTPARTFILEIAERQRTGRSQKYVKRPAKGSLAEKLVIVSSYTSVVCVADGIVTHVTRRIRTTSPPKPRGQRADKIIC